MAIQGGRPDNRQIVPYLFVRGVAQAIEFYRRAFGAVELYRSPMPGGKGMFAQIKVQDSTVQLADEAARHEGMTIASPQSVGAVTAIMEMYVDDVDAAYERAVGAGAQPTMPPCDTFWGDRYGWVTDPFGHIWALATVRETVPPDEVERRMNDHLANMPE